MELTLYLQEISSEEHLSRPESDNGPLTRFRKRHTKKFGGSIAMVLGRSRLATSTSTLHAHHHHLNNFCGHLREHRICKFLADCCRVVP